MPRDGCSSSNDERHLKPAAQMARLFADTPEAVENTVRLAERLDFTLQNLGYEFPKYPRARRRDDGFLSAQGDDRRARGHGTGTVRGGAGADRARTGSDHPSRVQRIFPDRLGHGEFLQGAGHPRARPGQRGEQRGLLLRSASRRATPSRAICSSSGSLPKAALPGRTSTWICRAATGASVSSRKCIAATASMARR